MPIEDSQVMTDADRYLFRRLHEHARTLERIIAEHPDHPDRPEFEAAIADLNRAAELLMRKAIGAPIACARPERRGGRYPRRGQGGARRSGTPPRLKWTQDCVSMGMRSPPQFVTFFGSTISKLGLNSSNNENRSMAFSIPPTSLISPDWTAAARVERRNTTPFRVSRIRVNEASASGACLFRV